MVVIIDKSQTFGLGNSSENSEVIHAGYITHLVAKKRITVYEEKENFMITAMKNLLDSKSLVNS